MTSYILSGYPLSRGYVQGLEAKLATRLQPIQLADLRQGGVVRMFRALRRFVGTNLYIAYEEPSSRAALPILRLAAFLTRIGNQFVVDEQLQIARVRRTETAAEAIGVVGASVFGLARCALSMLRAHRLLNAPRKALSVRGKRILYLNANLWFGIKAGGSVGHISGVANALADEGFEVLFAYAGGRLMVRNEIPYQGLRPPKLFGMPWEINYYAFDDLVVKQLEPLARKFAPSFIYQRMSLGNTSGVRLSRRLRLPLVLEYNGSEVWVARNWGRPLRFDRVAERAEEVCLRHAHLIVTVSDALRDELRGRGVDPSRIVTYPNCIDPSMFNPDRFSGAAKAGLRKRYGIEPDATVVTFIGSFGQWHGVPVLAQVIRRLVDLESAWLDYHKVRFLLIGDGIKMSEVRSILQHRVDGEYVRLVGLIPQESAPLHLAASDILSSPHIANSDGSPFFGSPTKLFEYMAMGKAIVASDLDQLGSVLRQSLRANQLPTGDAAAPSDYLAVLCEPGSTEEHASGIKFLVDHPSWRRALGTNARSEALRRYTWSNHVRHILAALHQTSTE